MGISKVIAVASCVPGAAAFLFWGRLPMPAKIVLTQATGVGIIVSIAASKALCDSTTWLLGKNERSGKVSLLGYLAFWPYHLGLRLRMWWRSKTRKEPRVQQIIPGWYLGSWPMSEDMLPEKDVAVIDVTCELPKMHRQNAYICIPTWDTRGPSMQGIQQALQFAQKQRSAGRPVFVHCAHGHGRSVVVIGAALVHGGHFENWEVAVAEMKKIRPKIKLNSLQREALKSWNDFHTISGNGH